MFYHHSQQGQSQPSSTPSPGLAANKLQQQQDAGGWGRHPGLFTAPPPPGSGSGMGPYGGYPPPPQVCPSYAPLCFSFRLVPTDNQLTPARYSFVAARPLLNSTICTARTILTIPTANTLLTMATTPTIPRSPAPTTPPILLPRLFTSRSAAYSLVTSQPASRQRRQLPTIRRPTLCRTEGRTGCRTPALSLSGPETRTRFGGSSNL